MEIAPGPAQADGARERERLGLALAMLESGLAELPAVVPLVHGAPPSPGLAAAPVHSAARWKLTVSVARDGSLQASACDAEDNCAPLRRDIDWKVPHEGLSAVLNALAERLGRPSPRPLPPVAKDPYAVLLVGRGAASFYGVTAAVPTDRLGDRRRDPVERALFIEPRAVLARWIEGRRHLALGQLEQAHHAFNRVTVLASDTVLFRADEAAVLLSMGHLRAASTAWGTVAKRGGDDPRFAVPHARSLLHNGRVPEAARVFDQLPPALQTDPVVLEAKVALADAGGPHVDVDALLALWQAQAPLDPVPVRRRIAARVEEKRYAEALDLSRELEARGAAEEAGRLSLALAVALRDWEGAAEIATAQGKPQLSARIRARGALEADPAAVPEEAALLAPIDWVVRGRAYLAGGRSAEALADADRALRQDRWLAEALALREDSLRALGRSAEADEAATRLRQADPAWALQAADVGAPVAAVAEASPPEQSTVAEPPPVQGAEDLSGRRKLLSAATPAELAPGPEELAGRIERLERAVLAAEEAGRSLARVHNAWAERLAAGTPVCRPGEVPTPLEQARLLGARHRDEVQSSRMEARRLERIVAAPTVEPFLDADRRGHADRLLSRVAGQLQSHAELSAWHTRHVEPRAAGCASPIDRAEAASGR